MWEASPMGESNQLRTSFDIDPDRYERARPTYPAELFDAIFERLPANGTTHVLEVGPGTGQATRALVERAGRVSAVEPGARFAERLAATYCQVEVHHGDFETVDLELHSFEAIVAATSYHWIIGEDRIARPHGLLRPGGWLATIDMVQVGDPVDRGYFERVQPIYASFGDHSHNWSPPTRGSIDPKLAAETRASSLFDDVTVIEVDWNQTYSSAQYRDLVMTYSGTLVMAPDEQRDLVDQLVAVIDDEYDGVLVRPLVAVLTLAQAADKT